MKLAPCLMGCVLACSCVTRNFSEVASTNVEWSDKAYQGNETILVRGNAGELALAKIGPAFSVQPFREATPQGQDGPRTTAMRSFRGKFYLLNLGKKSFVEVLDPAALQTTEKMAVSTDVFNMRKLPEEGRHGELHSDIAMGTDGTLFLTVPLSGSVFRFDAASKQFVPLLDLTSGVSGSFELRKMHVVDHLLFVGVHRYQGTREQALPGALAVVDLRDGSLKKVIDLKGEKPNVAMDYDAARHKLWVVTVGTQNRDNGAINRIDLDESRPSFLSVDFSTKIPTFEGALVLGKDFESLFYAEHTATPTRSTHVHHFLMGPSGTMEDLVKGETEGIDLTAAFEGSDSLQMNTSRDLAAISFDCGFAGCPRGGGLYFWNGATGMPYRKLYSKGKVPPTVTPTPETVIPFLVDDFAFLH